MIELQANNLKLDILRYAKKHDLDSGAVALAVADVLATIAATSDKLYGQQNLQDRLDAFCKRVEETYGRVRVVQAMACEANQ